MLYAPGSSPRLLVKVFEAGADAVIFDLEDAVAMQAKAEARRLVTDVLEQLSSEPDPPVFVRVNAAGSGMLEEDLAAITLPRLTGVKLPKVDGPDDVQRCDALLGMLERERGIAGGSIALMLGIESAAGVESIEAIARASSRTWCLAFGAEDFAADTGSDATALATESLYARSRMVIASRAAGIASPFDSVYPHLDRPQALAAHARASRRLGFQHRWYNFAQVINILHKQDEQPGVRPGRHQSKMNIGYKTKRSLSANDEFS